MRALVVYESMYGNTHRVAISIAAGLSATHEVTLVPVTQATSELVDAADLVVAGGPTHMHRMSTSASRRMAVNAGREDGSGLTMDPDADGPGVREWLDGSATADALAVAFDTRLSGVPALTGRASRGISRLMKRHGFRPLAPPESFLVSKQNTLLVGEAERARGWGVLLGARAVDAASRVA